VSNYFTLQNNKIISHDQPDPASSSRAPRGSFLMNDKWLVVFFGENIFNSDLRSHQAVRYIQRDGYLLMQAAKWGHTFVPYTLKFNKIK
jgi:hypothetical protein